MIYRYKNITPSPNLDQIHLDVIASAMSDKNIEYCRWDESDKILKVSFIRELRTENKIALDLIINKL